MALVARHRYNNLILLAVRCQIDRHSIFTTCSRSSLPVRFTSPFLLSSLPGYPSPSMHLRSESYQVARRTFNLTFWPLSFNVPFHLVSQLPFVTRKSLSLELSFANDFFHCPLPLFSPWHECHQQSYSSAFLRLFMSTSSLLLSLQLFSSCHSTLNRLTCFLAPLEG